MRKFDYEKQLQRYPHSCQTAVKHVASRHPSLRDLACSFPALLLVCAVQHKGLDRKRLIAGVIAGESLNHLASVAGLPMWTRKLPPQAFAGAIGRLPDSPFAARRIVNLLPKDSKDWARWLSFITHAMQWGDEGFALWIARVFKDIPKRFKECDLRRFALWAWFSARPQSAAGRLILRRWSLAMSWKAAENAVDCWLESLELFVVLGRDTIHYAKHTDGIVNGLTFVTLRSAEEVFQEVQTFDNCVRSYAHCLKRHSHRLVSVRRNGTSIALLCATEGGGQRRFTVEELRAPRNGMVDDGVAEAVRAWFLAQDPLVLESDVGPFDERLCQRQWQEFWKPYWMEKGRDPVLPFRADENSLRNLRW